MIQLTRRIVQCFHEDRYGNICGLPKGHSGPHGHELPEEKDARYRDLQRSKIRLWLPKEKN